MELSGGRALAQDVDDDLAAPKQIRFDFLLGRAVRAHGGDGRPRPDIRSPQKRDP